MKEKLILGDSVFFWNKADNALIYDAGRRQRILVNKGDSQSVRSICENLAGIDGLMTAMIDRSSLDKYGLDMVNSIIDGGFGRLRDENAKDCAIPPRPIITNDLDYCADEKSLKNVVAHMDMLSYLRCVTFYMGGRFRDNEICYQIPYPISSKDKLDGQQVLKVLKESYSYSAVHYRLVMSDLDKNRLDTLSDLLSPYKNRVTFIVAGGEEEECLELMLNDGFGVECIIDPLFRTPEIYSDRRIKYQLIVRREEDLDYLKLAEGITAVAVYDNNSDFITKNYLLSEDDVVSTDASRRQIFIHQKINLNYWGQLFVSPKGELFSSPMMDKCLGSVNEPLPKIIAKEFIQNYNWRRVRNNPTCSRCVYQWLCPSPTPIEAMLKRDTICKCC